MEKDATEQQSLVAVVTDIAHLTQAEATAPSDQVAPIHEASVADAAQGLALVDVLHNRVPAIDNLELGSAFEDSREYHQALVSFARAATDATDPFYRSKALRAAAGILYYIGGRGNDLKARGDTAQDIPRVRRPARRPEL